MSHEHKLTCIQMRTWSVLFIVYIYFSYLNDTILKKKVQFKIKFTSNQHTYKCKFEWVQAICHWLVLTFQSRTLPRNSPHTMSQNHKRTMQYEQRCAICNICIDSCIPVSLKKRSVRCPEKAEFENDHHSCSKTKGIMVNKYK